MKTFKELSENEKLSESYRKIFKIISGVYPNNPAGVKDSKKGHTLDEIEEIQSIQYEIHKSHLARSGISYQTLDELKEKSRIDVLKLQKQIIEKQKIGVKDSFYNPITGIGTGIDPNYYTTSSIPLSVSPYEASSVYSNGGLTEIIINKKSEGVLLNDFNFQGLEADDSLRLKEYAIKKGFDRALPLRDGLIFGGSVLYPSFKKDNLESFNMSIQELIKKGILTKNSIDYWIDADRWNVVHVPNYNITARDYLFPDNIYVPLGSQRVNTQRASLIKPHPLPYWSAIQQLGWSKPDFIGYLKQIYDYEIMISTLPIMFQQMSLIFQVIPLDATMVMNGVDAMEEIIKENEKKLREASLLTPRAYNSANSLGDIKVIERNFTGFKEIVMSMRQDIGSRSTIPESVLFHTQPTGFSDNKEDILLKQSESIKMIGNKIEPQLKNTVKILTISCFGPDSEQAKRDVSIKFGSPIVSTEIEKADIGAKCSQFLASLITTQEIPIDIAINISKQFFDYNIDDEDMERLKQLKDVDEDDQEKVDIITKEIENILNTNNTKIKEKII